MLPQNISNTYRWDIKVIQRATGIFSFWNRLIPAALVLSEHELSIIDKDSKLKTLTVDFLTEKCLLSELHDYKNGMVLKHGQGQTEIQAMNQDEMLIILKTFSTERYHGFNLSDKSINEGFGVLKSQTIKNQACSIASVALVLIVLKRRIRERRFLIEETSALIIQKFYRGYRRKKSYQKFKKSAILLQSIHRMNMAKRLKQDLILKQRYSKLQIHRKSVVNEILTTELSYVQQLETLVKFIIKPLRALEKKAGIASDQISLIFANLEDIYDKHLEYAEILAPVAENFTDTTMIGDTFLKLTEWLHIYIPYCNGFEDAKSMLQKCQKNEKFVSFLSTVDSTKVMNRQDLSSFLILPVQRIPRYELLLKDLIRHTWTTHPDYEKLQLSLLKIHEAAKNVNRAKSFNESRHRLAHLQINLSNSNTRLASNGSLSVLSATSVTPTNELEEMYIGEGFLTYVEIEKKPVIAQNEQKGWDIDALLTSSDPDLSNNSGSLLYNEFKPIGQAMPVYGYLFENALVLTKRPKGTDIQRFKSKAARSQNVKDFNLMNISLNAASVEHYRVTDQHTLSETIQNNKSEPSFMITSSDGRMYKLVAETQEQKKKWMQDINEAMDHLHKRKANEASDINDFLANAPIEEEPPLTETNTKIVIMEQDDDIEATSVSSNEPSLLTKSNSNSKTDVSKGSFTRSPMLLRRLFKSHEVLDGSKSPQNIRKEKKKSSSSQTFLSPN